jgi:pimeloyl-ACP methyl ester carboxylesterase
MGTRGFLVFCQFILWALPVLAQPANDTWVDKSPHKEMVVTVNGVNLEYLDWGGNGETLLFLPGLGNTAHIFDDIAPQFAHHFHVLGLTRRGYGKSDKPAMGYDVSTLVEDLRQFLDVLKINRAILVGHSFAGVEMTRYAELFPDRVDKLVYLECAYTFDQPGTMELLGQIDSLTPHPSDADRANFSALLRWSRNNRPGWNDACESDLRNTRIITPDGYSSHGSTPESVDETLAKVAMETPRDYTKLKMPVLAFFADHRMDRMLAQADDASRKKTEEIVKSGKDWLRNQIEQFKQEVKDCRVVELPDTDHFCFIQRQGEVVRQMQSFLERN